MSSRRVVHGKLQTATLNVEARSRGAAEEEKEAFATCKEKSPCNDKVKVKAADVEKVPASRQFSSNTRMALGWPRMAWDDQW